MDQVVSTQDDVQAPGSGVWTPGTDARSKVNALADWLIAQALADTDVETIVGGCCRQLAEAGVPVVRLHLSFSVLHPLYSNVGYLWRLNEGLEVSGYRHVADGVERDLYLNSPYYYLEHNGLTSIRRTISPSIEPQFPILAELREGGATDYLAFALRFDPAGEQVMMGSWTTDEDGGFSVDDIRALHTIQERLAVACKVAIRSAIARRVLATYLGRDAGARVLSGQIRRGDAETIQAAIVWGDMRGSTVLADQLGRGPYTETLNVFFDTVAGAIEDAGGEILSLAGDGFLAVFHCGRTRSERVEACRKALAGAVEAPKRMAEVNRERETRHEVQLEFGIGLHIGNVMYGNVGLIDRLSFSAFGAAVNETVRLQEVAKHHGIAIVASGEFTDYAGGEWETLGETVLRGFENAVAVYSPKDGTGDEVRIPRRDRAGHGLTDAEAIVLLHRAAKP